MANTNERQLVATAEFPALNTLPDLAECEVAPIELVGEYWSPMEKGESKRVFFYGFGTQSVIEQATGELRDLDIVQFIEQRDGDFRLIQNGSARLVGQFNQMARFIEKGDAFLITYLGKEKTTTGKFADSWSVKRIFIKK